MKDVLLIYYCLSLRRVILSRKKQIALVLEPCPITGDGYITHARRNWLLFARRHRGPLDCMLGVQTILGLQYFSPVLQGPG